jgi:hypothetical protein
MSETKRDVAPPGWFRRTGAAVASALTCLSALVFIGIGSVGIVSIPVGFLAADHPPDKYFVPMGLFFLGIYLMFFLIGFRRLSRRGKAAR